tara:strand:- start:3451 stop:3648 length:198 start_codon:yes stop_codon:yes gene_type:complete
MRIAKNIFARIGFEDIIVPVDEMESIVEEVSPQYFIGYEDEHGEECEEDGTYLRQEKGSDLIFFK